MSSVLTSFLVGIGWDTSNFDQGTKHIESSMGSVKSSVLQTAASIATLTAMTGAGLKFAKTTSEIDNFTRSIGVGRSDLLAFGGALQGMGGDADSAMGILTSLEQKRASILTGETGWIAPAARAGIDTNAILQATDSLDAVLRLSDQFKNAAPQQRLNMADALGFDPATVAFLSQGRTVVEATLNQYRDARPPVDGLVESSRDLTQEWSRLEALAGGIGDKIQSKLIPAITDVTSEVNEFLTANKNVINEGIDEHFGAIATSVALLAAGSTMGTIAKLATYIPAIGGGLSMAATAASSMAMLGAAGVVGWNVGTEIRESGVLDTVVQQIGYENYQQFFNYRMDQLLGNNVTGMNPGEGPLFGLLSGGADAPGALTSGWGFQPTPPRPQPTTINVNATLEMDGKVLADKVLSVVSDSNQAALDDLQSTTER